MLLTPGAELRYTFGKITVTRQRAEVRAVVIAFMQKRSDGGKWGSSVIKGAIVSGFVLPSFE
jgi:hypothetical protein